MNDNFDSIGLGDLVEISLWDGSHQDLVSVTAINKFVGRDGKGMYWTSSKGHTIIRSNFIRIVHKEPR